MTTFYVEDTSPTIAYSPFADTFTTPNLSAGWNPYFEVSGLLSAPGQIGQGNSLHITQLDGASLSLRWHGTDIELRGNTTDASVIIQLDGRTPVNAKSAAGSTLLASFSNLQNTEHNLTLTARMNTQTTVPPMVVFDTAIITSPATDNSTLNAGYLNATIDDRNISYQGKWTFDETQSHHQSNAVGDSVRSTFFGTALFVLGTTSPSAGNYSVTLDGQTSRLSAKSSFTRNDSLLFFASGLDPIRKHQWNMINDDGSTMILPDGALTVQVFGDADTPPGTNPTPNPTVPTKSSFSSGTIAAFALAGVLAFLLATGLLYLFAYRRPRQRRQRALRREQLALKEEAAAGIIDVSPDFIDSERRRSGGWSLWKRDMEGGGKSLSGIDFRRSRSGSKSPSDRSDIEHQYHAGPANQSQRSSNSSAPRLLAWMKGKHVKTRSSTPSFNIDLQQISRSNGSPDLSYLSTPTMPTESFAPASPPIEPRTVPTARSAPMHFERRPQQSGSGTGRISFYPASTHDDQDMGSVREFDTRSVIGPAAALEAIRGLSPRTSEASSNQSEIPQIVRVLSAKREAPKFVQKERERKPVDVQLDERGIFIETPSPTLPRTHTTSNPDPVALSPRPHRLSQQSRVHFEDSTVSESRQISQVSPTQETQSTFRLTPMSPMSDKAPANQESSFLDFSSNGGSSNGTSLSSPPPSLRVGSVYPKSRWSNTTVPSTTDQQHESSGSGSGSHSHSQSQSFLSLPNSSPASFPFPVSLPASPHHPEGHRPSPPRPQRDSQAPISPADSVPMSMSDLHFRHSDSDDGSDTHPEPDPSLPRHPPLPPRDSASDLATPTYVVQRVFGVSPTTPSFGHTRQDSTTLKTPTSPKPP